ncbi:heat shock protein HslJ [Desulfurispira natronophila]|uniref:Heat shock protein HslJ n=1 Tax=Desulfurispira natronophila TaxID=682562 RepID=A0A7W8DGH0_9BACT|nr:heat shock protein HslJ [Desulfurispira natronophila]
MSSAASALVTGVLLLAAIAGCSTTPDPAQRECQKETAPLEFLVCGHRLVVIEQINPDTVFLYVDERTLALEWDESQAGYVSLPAGTAFVPGSSGGKLVFEGEELPECYPTKPLQLPFRATGNEPPWRLDITHGEMILITEYGQRLRRFAEPVSKAGTDGSVYFYAKENGTRLEVVVTPAICIDTMTGMPYPYHVQTLSQKTLSGCGGEPESLLRGVEWQVTHLKGDPLSRGIQMTLQFTEEGLVRGTAGCNTYMGTFRLTGERMLISDLATTKMACDPETMAQEQLFLSLLIDAYRFFVTGDGELELFTASGPILRAVPGSDRSHRSR